MELQELAQQIVKDRINKLSSERTHLENVRLASDIENDIQKWLNSSCRDTIDKIQQQADIDIEAAEAKTVKVQEDLERQVQVLKKIKALVDQVIAD